MSAHLTDNIHKEQVQSEPGSTICESVQNKPLKVDAPTDDKRRMQSIDSQRGNKVTVQLLDGAGNNYAFYLSGAPADCPPVPRVGEHVTHMGARGLVTRVEYTIEELPDYASYGIAVHVRDI